MSKKNFIRNLSLMALIFISSVSINLAQKPDKTPPSEDPNDKVEKGQGRSQKGL